MKFNNHFSTDGFYLTLQNKALQTQDTILIMDTTKSFYKIAEVAELLNVTQSTLRYWESQFKTLAPARSSSGRRYYTPKDIENLEIIKFLVKDKGLRIESAREQMENNADNISRRVRLINTLKAARLELTGILGALDKRR